MPDSPSLPENPSSRATISHFEPVPRKVTHEHGWTPARQRAFIEKLAETASVRQAAAAAVNMSKVSAYQLKNHPQGGDFARAWAAAIDAGVQHLKDIAFERAVEGRLDPVWQSGKLVGHKRVYSDGLLMFLLRQYGTDENGRNVTVQYVRTRSAVATQEGAAGSAAEAEATTMTVRARKASARDSAKQEAAAKQIAEFDGVELDATAQSEIAATLAACAERQREIGGSYDDPEISSFTAGKDAPLWLGSFEPAEPSWQTIGDERYLPEPEGNGAGAAR